MDPTASRAAGEPAAHSPSHPNIVGDGDTRVGRARVAQWWFRATPALRFAHFVSRATVRNIMNLVVWLHTMRWLTPAQITTTARRFDDLAREVAPPSGFEVRATVIGGFTAEWIIDQSALHRDPTDGTILYFHGGGLVACGLHTHRAMTAQIARAAGMPLLNVAYRQLPEVHVAETIRDCVRSYEHLLERGVEPGRIVLAGDSVGAGLAFSVALTLRDRRMAMPRAIVAISPWADFDSTQRRNHPNIRCEAFTPDSLYAILVRWGVMVDGNLDPSWSPVNHDFTGLPPVLIQVGTSEVLLPDAERLFANCVESGVSVTLQRWDSGLHVLPVAAPFIPDARDAIAKIGEFIREETSTTCEFAPTSQEVTP